MNDKEIISIIEQTLKEKLDKNTDFIRYTFYELRIKYNLSEKDTDRFLELIRTKLQNENYRVYFTGARFEYKHAKMKVQDNELMISIKDIKEEDEKNGIIQRKSSKKIKRNGNKS